MPAVPKQEGSQLKAQVRYIEYIDKGLARCRATSHAMSMSSEVAASPSTYLGRRRR